MQSIPAPGEIYRHFKENTYKVLALAADSETEELVVVYQALYDGRGIWVRPLTAFIERLDREKYPEAAQEFRFERISEAKETLAGFAEPERAPGAPAAMEESGASAPQGAAAGPAAPANAAARNASKDEDGTQILLNFFDAQEMQEKLDILMRGQGLLSTDMLVAAAESLDVPVPNRAVKEILFADIVSTLKMRIRYEKGRR